jgi:hypothetical protein
LGQAQTLLSHRTPVLLVLLILGGVRLLGHGSVKDVLLISAASGR